MLIGTEPVSVDLSSTSDAYFVKDFDRRRVLEADDQFHNHGIKGRFAKFAVRMGSYSNSLAVRAVISDEWIAAGYGVVGSDVSLITSSPESGIYSNDQNAVKVPMVLPDGRHVCTPSSTRSPTHAHQQASEILSAPWNIDKDANPELDKFRVWR
jgi:hypothetical protein